MSLVGGRWASDGSDGSAARGDRSADEGGPMADEALNENETVTGIVPAEEVQTAAASRRKLMQMQRLQRLFAPVVRIARARLRSQKHRRCSSMRRDVIQAVDIVGSIRGSGSFLREWSDEHLYELCRGALIKSMQPHSVLVYMDEPAVCASIIVVVRGSVSFHHNLREAPLRTEAAPFVVGDRDQLCEAPSTVYCTAATDVDFVILDRARFWQLVYEVMPRHTLKTLQREIGAVREDVVRRYFPQTVPLMKQCWVCCDLGTDKIEDLIRALRPHTFFPGEAIVTEGTFTPFMYFLRRGEAEVWVRSAERPVGHLRPGVSFGEMSVLFNERRNASVIAKTVCDVWALHQRSFDMICDAKLRAAVIRRATKMRTRWLAAQKEVPENPLQTVIRTVPSLRDCNDAAFTELIAAAEPRVFPQTAVVASKSEVVDGLYIVVRGLARSQRTEIDDAREYRSGTYFGEWCLVPHRWPLSVVSVSMMDVWWIAATAIERSLSKHAHLEAALRTTRTALTMFERKHGDGSLIYVPRGLETRREVTQSAPGAVRMRHTLRSKSRSIVVVDEFLTPERNFGVPVVADPAHQRRLQELNRGTHLTPFELPSVQQQQQQKQQQKQQPPPLPGREKPNASTTARDGGAAGDPEDSLALDQAPGRAQREGEDVVLLGRRTKLLHEDPDFGAGAGAVEQQLLEQMSKTPSSKHHSVLARIRKHTSQSSFSGALGMLRLPIPQLQSVDSTDRVAPPPPPPEGIEAPAAQAASPLRSPGTQRGGLQFVSIADSEDSGASDDNAEVAAARGVAETRPRVAAPAKRPPSPPRYVPINPHSYAPVLPLAIQAARPPPAKKGSPRGGRKAKGNVHAAAASAALSPPPGPRALPRMPTEAEADAVMDILFSHSAATVQKVDDGEENEATEEKDYLDEAWREMLREPVRPPQSRSALPSFVANCAQAPPPGLHPALRESSNAAAALEHEQPARRDSRTSVASSMGPDGGGALLAESDSSAPRALPTPPVHRVAASATSRESGPHAGRRRRHHHQRSQHREGDVGGSVLESVPRERPLTQTELRLRALPQRPPHLPELHRCDILEGSATGAGADASCMSSAATTVRSHSARRLMAAVGPPLELPRSAATPRGRRRNEHDAEPAAEQRADREPVPLPPHNALLRFAAAHRAPPPTRVVRVPCTSSLAVQALCDNADAPKGHVSATGSEARAAAPAAPHSASGGGDTGEGSAKADATTAPGEGEGG